MATWNLANGKNVGEERIKMRQYSTSEQIVIWMDGEAKTNQDRVDDKKRSNDEMGDSWA